MSKILFRLPKNNNFTLDLIITTMFLFISIIFIVWSISLKHYGVQLPTILLVSSIFYLRFKNKILVDAGLPQLPVMNRIRLIFHIIFVISISFIIWLSWSNLYYRPPIYFALVLVTATSVIIDIFFLDETKIAQITIALFKIIVLSLTIYASIYYEFSGIYGADPWWHNEWIQETIDLGHISLGNFLGNSYYLFPVFHLTGAMTKIITNLPIYSSVFCSVGVIMAISSLFVFLIGKKLVNIKAGLLTSLVFSLTADNIERATALIPMSLGFFFFLAILYIAIGREEKRVSLSVLIILLSTALILTHTIAAFVTLITLIVIFIGIKLYNKLGKPIINYEVVSLAVVLFFAVSMITRWMQNRPGSPTFFDYNIRRLLDSLQIDSQFVLSAPPSVTSIISYGVDLFNQSGYFLLLGFGIIGILTYLHYNNRSMKKMVLILTAGALIAFPYGFLLFRIESILPDRWFIFLYVPLSILAIAGLLCVSNLIKNKTRKLSMIMLLVLVIIFTMITNSIANDDSPIIYNGAVRIGYTQSELTAVKTLSYMMPGRPITDIYYGAIFPYVIDYNKYMDMVRMNNRIFIYRNYYLHNPEWNERYQGRIHEGGIGNFKPKPVVISDYMKDQGIDRQPLIYDNGNIKTYIIL